MPSNFTFQAESAAGDAVVATQIFAWNAGASRAFTIATRDHLPCTKITRQSATSVGSGAEDRLGPVSIDEAQRAAQLRCGDIPIQTTFEA